MLVAHFRTVLVLPHGMSVPPDSQQGDGQTKESAHCGQYHGRQRAPPLYKQLTKPMHTQERDKTFTNSVLREKKINITAATQINNDVLT